MGETFADLGIPFPLFEAAVESTNDYDGLGDCPLCGQPGRHLFLARSGNATSIERVPICYECIRDRRASMPKDTEFGFIDSDLAAEGRTHGVPGLIRPDFESLSGGGDGEQWCAARVASEWLWELLRTPRYVTWQGERWLFCCRRPMIYVGEWGRAEFARHSLDGDAEAYAAEAIGDYKPGVLDGAACVYVFRCPDCGRHAAHYDFD